MNNPLILATAAMLSFAFPARTAEFATFTYDTAGRLIAANYGSGKTATFQYDAAGNLRRTANVIITDTDNDGMADSWEQTYFNTLARNGNDDFDQDGFSDAAEFLAGTLPNDPNSLLRMNRHVTNTVAQTSVSWSAITGRSYRVQYKNRLTDPGWNDLAGIVIASSTNAVKVDVTSAGEPQRYYRVEALQ